MRKLWWLANINKVVIQVGCKWIKNLQLLHFRSISQELPIELITDYGKVWKVQHDDTFGNGDSIKDRWNVDFGKPIVTYIPTNHTTQTQKDNISTYNIKHQLFPHGKPWSLDTPINF